MGFISNIIDGVKNISSTVGKVAGALSGIPVIGGVASTVANVANTINKGANFASDIYNAVAPTVQEIGGAVKKAVSGNTDQPGSKQHSAFYELIKGKRREGFTTNDARNVIRQQKTINAAQGGQLGSAGPGRTTPTRTVVRG